MREYRTKKYNVYYLQIDKVNKIIDAATSLKEQVAIKILARTGMRRFELCNLRIQDVNFEGKSIYIPRAKMGGVRSVPIDDDTLQSIKFYIGKRKSGKLIQSNYKKSDGIDVSRINHIVGKLGKIAKVENPDPKRDNINPHIFRHSFIRHLLKVGVSANYIQQLAGHADIKSTLQIYGTPSFVDLQEKFNEILPTLKIKEIKRRKLEKPK